MCAIDSLRKFDFRKMTINGKELVNVEKKIDEKWRYDHFFFFAKGCSLQSGL